MHVGEYNKSGRPTCVCRMHELLYGLLFVVDVNITKKQLTLLLLNNAIKDYVA